jgi:hypothetical protein
MSSYVHDAEDSWTGLKNAQEEYKQNGISLIPHREDCPLRIDKNSDPVEQPEGEGAMDKLLLHSNQANEIRHRDMLAEAEGIFIESYLDDSFNNDIDEVAKQKLRVLLDAINGYRVKHLAVKHGDEFDFGSWLPKVEAIAKMNYALVPLNEAGVFSNVRFSMQSDGRYVVCYEDKRIIFPDMLRRWREGGETSTVLRKQCRDADLDGLTKISKALAGIKPELFSSHYATKTRFIRQVCDYIYANGQLENKRPSSWEAERRFEWSWLDEPASYTASATGRKILRAVGEMGNRLLAMDIINDEDEEEDDE